MTRAGAPLDELAHEVAAVGSNLRRDEVAFRLLGELAATRDWQRSARIQQLLRQAWLFHEDPGVRVAMQVGIARMNSQDYPGAVRAFADAAALDAGYAEAWKKLAAARYLLRDYYASLEDMQRALRLEPAHFGALSGLGLTLQKLDRLDEAAEAFKANSEVHPMAPGPRVNLLVTEAQRLVRDAVSAAPAAVPWVGTIVITCMVLLDVAGSGLRSSGSLPGMADSPYQVVQMERVQRTLPDGGLEVRENFQRVTRTGAPLGELLSDVEALDTNRERGQVSSRLLDELAAAESPERALSISQLVWRTWLFHAADSVNALMRTGHELMQEGDLAAAHAQFTLAAQLDPHFAEAWNKRATVNYLMQEYQASLADIERTLALEPRHFGALSGRGLVLMQLERYGEAAESFREANEVYPASVGLDLDAEFAEALQKEVGDDPS